MVEVELTFNERKYFHFHNSTMDMLEMLSLQGMVDSRLMQALKNAK